MIYVEGGDFTLGIIGKEISQTVKINNYQISAFEITVGEYQLFTRETGCSMPPEPKWGWKKDHPIVNVTYDEALAYCQWLSEKNTSFFRLPTEAEWEYAARGGKKSKNYKFSGANNPSRVAWFRVNSGNRTHAVGKKKANELGLYDMSGNAWEWCLDWYKEYHADRRDEMINLDKVAGKIVRGGAADRLSSYSKVTKRLACYRNCRSAFNGFRVVEVTE
ncbi:formylglycine-generating enzyme family protein [Pseudopedobacter saltans]|nr:SUMF1/EgtB/PvdO family nonheme iron enzyme [Pseudopedobacter saltans]